MTADHNSAWRWSRSLSLDILPIATILLLLLLCVLPLATPQAARLGGLWPLMGVTYWTLVRPRAVKPWVVFILGLLTDCVTFLPFGMHAFVFVFAQAVLKKQRRFLVGQGFWVLWAAFILLAFVSAMLLYFLSLLLQGGAVPIFYTIYSIVLATALLPLLLWSLDRVHVVMDLFDEPV